MSRPHKCMAGCGRRITWRFAICSSCEEIYGNRATDWPDWLRERWNMTQRDRRREKKIIKYETEAGLNDEVFDAK